MNFNTIINLGVYMKLYHYVHCPFCVRVRMALSFLEISFESIVLPYNDEATPLSLTNVKMLPIMDFGGRPMNESLDIIKKLDTNNKLDINQSLEELEALTDLTDKIGKSVHSMAMPYWIWTPEFDNESRKYFQNKKEAKRGPFSELVKRQDQFTSELNKVLSELEKSLTPYFNSKNLTLRDIVIASHLWGMFIVPEFRFSENIHNYLMLIKKECSFNYHEDFWN